jgi:hypothetical protein
MASALEVYLEVGTRRVFAGAIEWPGWCRSARGEDAAVEAFLDYGPRYRAALGAAGRGLKRPAGVSDLRVVERLKGDATTEFGAPSIAPAADDRRLDPAGIKRQIRLLRACWSALDERASAAAGATLTKGPRGGGRDLDAIVAHVFEADRGYLSRIGDRFPGPKGDADDATAGLRDTIAGALEARARGEAPAHPRRSGAFWSPRYFVRRSAWHALDHAWEIEDRAVQAPT